MKKRRAQQLIILNLSVLLAIVIIVIAAILIKNYLPNLNGKATVSGDKAKNKKQPEKNLSKAEKKAEKLKKIEAMLSESDRLMKGCNFEQATAKVDEVLKLDAKHEKALAKKMEIQAAQNNLVEYKGEVTQVFFHELIVDPKIVFGKTNGDPGGHNSVMTTLSEFNKIIDQMYTKGYMLIYFRDLYDVTVDSAGKKVFTKKPLMLPPGKIPFIMSEDDVAFYRKTRIAIGGYGQKYVLDKEGKVKVLYKDQNGKETVGDYDLLPALETFIDKHPDFSYKNAKAYIGLTGFDGAFGYRINKDASGNATYKEDIEMVKKIAEAAKKQGFEFACHSYAHGNQQNESIPFLDEDTKQWVKEIGDIVGSSDVYILPKGNWWFAKNWTINSAETQGRFNTMAAHGFNFICGVGMDAYRKEYPNYVFMDRYNFDGYAMHHNKERLAKFFDVSTVWDELRPGALGL